MPQLCHCDNPVERSIPCVMLSANDVPGMLLVERKSEVSQPLDGTSGVSLSQ
jgi:hypothetical protein